jgi:hypothetical protein
LPRQKTRPAPSERGGYFLVGGTGFEADYSGFQVFKTIRNIQNLFKNQSPEQIGYHQISRPVASR